MNSAEKKRVYTFLQKARYTLTGYPPEDYFEEGSFSDDPESLAHMLAVIDEDIKSCGGCSLASCPRSTLAEDAPERAAVMVITEGRFSKNPEEPENFGDGAGALLEKMLGAIGLRRNRNCLITSVIKCGLSENRTSTPEEAAACMGFLHRQIAAVRPALILSLGDTPPRYLLGSAENLESFRGRFSECPVSGMEKTVPLMATYHPSSLLQDQALKAPAWEDLKVFGRRLQELVPGYRGDEPSRRGGDEPSRRGGDEPSRRGGGRWPTLR